MRRLRQVLSWIITAVQAQYKAGAITDIEKAPLLDQVMRFRAAMGSLFDYQDMPFPFIYVSFVTGTRVHRLHMACLPACLPACRTPIPYPSHTLLFAADQWCATCTGCCSPLRLLSASTPSRA